MKKQILEEKNNKKNKFLLEIEKEIKRLEKEVKKEKKQNLTLRNLKVLVRTIQYLTPYTISTLITLNLLNEKDIVLFNPKNNIYLNVSTIKKEIENLENYQIEDQYEIKTKAEKTPEYPNPNHLPEDQCNSFLKEYKTEETINNIEPETLDLNSFIDPTVKFEPYSTLTTIKPNPHQNPIENSTPIEYANPSTIPYLILITALQLAPIVYREAISDFDYPKAIKTIESQYEASQNSILTKKLEIKKENYNRLTRR